MDDSSLATEDVASIESFVGDWLCSAGVPGAAVAVVDDQTADADGFAARDLETQTPATPDTL